MCPPGVEGLPAGSTQQDRRAEMEFIGMVSILPPALCTPPSTEDWEVGLGTLVEGHHKATAKPRPFLLPHQRPFGGKSYMGWGGDGGSEHPVPWP